MLLIFVLDVIVLFPLGWVFYMLWRERKRFPSFIPVIIGVGFLFTARLCEVLVEHPAIHIAGLLGFSHELFSLTALIIGGFADALGVLFLVIGFVQAIRAQHAQERIINDLEALLPICAYCKKYRTEDGAWHPIEKYLEDIGAPRTSHGMCPECTVKVQEEIKKAKRRRKKADTAVRSQAAEGKVKLSE
jgi:hypothetical protein